MRNRIERNKSEEIFETYLKKNKIKYRRNYPVNKNKKNVDFYVRFPYKNGIFCEVKEVRKSKEGEIIAYKPLREDFKELRNKFKGRKIIKNPILLVTFNFSDNFFTGVTVAHAMLGELHLIQRNNKSNTELCHKGNAALTEKHKTTISGVFIYRTAGPHYLLKNPFAKNPIKSILFPDTKIISISPKYPMEELKKLSTIMVWSHKINS